MSSAYSAFIYSFQIANIIGFTINALVDNTSNYTAIFTGLFLVSSVMVCRDILTHSEEKK